MRLEDIAKAAGVSKTKASRALSGSPGVNAAEAERILRMAEEMRYKPNRLVQSLTKRRSGLIGMVIHDVSNPYSGELLGGVEEVVSGRDCAVVFSDVATLTGNDLRRLLEYRVDAIILGSLPHDGEQQKELRDFLAAGGPVLSLGAEVPPAQRAMRLDLPFAEGVAALVRHLVDLGHERVAFVGNETGDPARNERLAAFMSAANALGISVPPDLVLCAPGYTDNVEGGMRAAESLVGYAQPPTAIVCFNDCMAFGVMAGIYDRGLVVGRDISVCGFDGTMQGQTGRPKLTTIDVRPRALGRIVAGAALDLAEGKAPDHTTLKASWSLVVGGSTGPRP